jgi:hypothetical protein
MRWLDGYRTAPRNTRAFHEANLVHIRAALGRSPVARITPTDITRMRNRLIDERTPALADRVYRTASAMFGSAAADGLCPGGSPVRSRKHRPRRQRDDHAVLERAQARQVLLQLRGWRRDTALIPSCPSAPASGRSRLSPRTTSTSHAAWCTSAAGSPPTATPSARPRTTVGAPSSYPPSSGRRSKG